MAALPLDEQFARLGIVGGDSRGCSPDGGRKFGPLVAPKPKKAQPQVPVIPKSNNVPTCLEPSFSMVLTGNNGANAPDATNTYSNINLYENHSSAGGPIYSNIHHPLSLSTYFESSPSVTGHEDDLPLPPPPPPSDPGYYSPLDISHDHLLHFPPPPCQLDVPSPPSPVSSSYSELRRAVGSTTGSMNYAPLSQSSNYESIYEPIQPRNCSAPGMSSLTHQSSYSSQYPSYGASMEYGSAGSANGAAASKDEDEVDVLTSLLVQSMDNAVDPEFFGMCAGCAMKVVGEGTGCTAMDRVFHIACFTCRICRCRLQGKPFYAVDNEPHCQECYLNSLEKCCVCAEAILDRILRATGKPYHPQCFTCIVCNLCLDGIPFTVDAANRIHCIDDFHKKFAPRCSVCCDPIMPEPGQEETVRVVALDRSFHVKCYKCEDCDLLLSSEAEGRGCYPLDGRVLCKSCNAGRINALTSCVTTEL